METCPAGWDRGRRRDYKRYCGIVTGDGRGRAVDRTVDRLIIALYSRTNAARHIRKSIRTGFIYFFHREQTVGRRRHARLSHVICPPRNGATRPGVRTLPTVAANPDNVSSVAPTLRTFPPPPFYRFLVRRLRSPSCCPHRVPIETTRSPGSVRQKSPCKHSPVGPNGIKHVVVAETNIPQKGYLYFVSFCTVRCGRLVKFRF